MRAHAWLLLLGLLGPVAGCRRPAADAHANTFAVPGDLLWVPQLPDWGLESSAPPARGGGPQTLLRLVRERAVPGSPRVTVVADPESARPAVLEEYLTRNLQDMAQLESQGQIHILDVEQRAIRIADQPAFRVRHEYTLGRGANQVALTQIAVFLVVRGRAVSVVGAGRTELFHPVAEQVEQMLTHLQLPTSGSQPAAAGRRGGRDIDLGRVGGQRER